MTSCLFVSPYTGARKAPAPGFFQPAKATFVRALIEMKYRDWELLCRIGSHRT